MKIEHVNKDNLESILPLIAEYQRFYAVAEIDMERNRKFFTQFAQENDRGALHLLTLDQLAIGFSTIYFTYSSTLAKEVAVLNDLYVTSAHRGNGYGKALLQHARSFVQRKGLARLQWLTAHDNVTAQQLYDSLGARKSQWCFYAMDV